MSGRLTALPTKRTLQSGGSWQRKEGWVEQQGRLRCTTPAVPQLRLAGTSHNPQQSKGSKPRSTVDAKQTQGYLLAVRLLICLIYNAVRQGIYSCRLRLCWVLLLQGAPRRAGVCCNGNSRGARLGDIPLLRQLLLNRTGSIDVGGSLGGACRALPAPQLRPSQGADQGPVRQQERRPS